VKGLSCDRRKTNIEVKGKKKDPLPFEKWIFHSGHAIPDSDPRIFVAMTST